MSKDKKALDLKFYVKVGIETENGSYNEDFKILSSEKSLTSALTTDTRKRKVIDFLEDLTEQVLRDASDVIHESKKLTDGQLEKQEQKENADF